MSENKISKLFKYIFPVIGLIIFIFAVNTLIKETRGISVSQIMLQMEGISAFRILAAVLLMAVSYLVLTFYDFLANKYIGSELSYKIIAPVSFSAFAIGHNLGVASLPGGIPNGCHVIDCSGKATAIEGY